MTSLHLAAKYNPNPDIVIALLETGANPSIEDDREMIAWDYIKERDSLSQTDAYWRLNEARWR